jgi:hypothetical protein
MLHLRSVITCSHVRVIDATMPPFCRQVWSLPRRQSFLNYPKSAVREPNNERLFDYTVLPSQSIVHIREVGSLTSRVFDYHVNDPHTKLKRIILAAFRVLIILVYMPVS